MLKVATVISVSFSAFLFALQAGANTDAVTNRQSIAASEVNAVESKQALRDKLALKAPPTMRSYLYAAQGDADESVRTRRLIEDFSQIAETEKFGEFERRWLRDQTSRLDTAVLRDLGMLAYERGYFSRAVTYLSQAWERSHRAEKSERGQEAWLAVASGAELAGIYARLGRREELRVLLAELETYQLSGVEKEKVLFAQQGLYMMDNQPEISFNCGTFGLINILKTEESSSVQALNLLAEARATPSGFSLEELSELAGQAGMSFRAARRSPGAVFIVPSLIHWKSDHYAALLEERDGLFLFRDPTFIRESWITENALEEEGSGYFMIPDHFLPEGWEWASAEEKASIHGRGYPAGQSPDDDGDHGGCPPEEGMAHYGLNFFRAAPVIYDTPLFYRTPVGPDIRFELSYFEASQVSIHSTWSGQFPNVGKGFMLNWLSYLDETNEGVSDKKIQLFLPDGRKETYFVRGAVLPDSETTLEDVRAQTRHYISASEMSVFDTDQGERAYSRHMANGTVFIYEHAVNASGSPARYHLTRIIDPLGLVTLIHYDPTTNRLDSVEDAFGYSSTFTYHSSNPASPDYWRVSVITDPFGRSAEFEYDSSGRLAKITDAVGIASEFTYSQGTYEYIDSITTPYGTTHFEVNYPGGFRQTTVTDPMGLQERVQYLPQGTSQLAGVTGSSPYPIEVPTSPAVDTAQINYANTLYWDKQAMQKSEGASTYAYQYHWLRRESHLGITEPVVSSVRAPLEHRVWFTYPNQTKGVSNLFFPGDMAEPATISRTIPDEFGALVTQTYAFEYNSLGHPTRMVDPLGRVTLIDYLEDDPAAGRVATRIMVEEDEEEVTLVELVYPGSGHPAYGKGLPIAMTLANGGSYTFTYNGKGQVIEVEDPLEQITRYTYVPDPRNGGTGPNEGYLVKVERTDPENASALVTLYTLGYSDDPSGDLNVRSYTDSEGYTLSFEWDALNRLTSVAYPDGTSEDYIYTGHDGRKLLAPGFYVDRAGQATIYFYNGNQQLSMVMDAEGRLTSYDWCSCGSLGRLIDAMGRVTTWERDIQGRVTAKYYPDGSRESYVWQSAISRLQSYSSPNDQAYGGPTASYSYYLDNNLAGVSYRDSQVPNVFWAYDPAINRVISRTDGQGTTSYSYYPYDDQNPGLGAGLLHTVDGPWDDDTLRFTYDALNRISMWEVVDDASPTPVSLQSEAYTYDSLGRVTGVSNNLGAFVYEYVGDSGLLSSVDYPNGQRTEYDYLPAHQGRWLQTIKNLSKASPERVNLSQFDYAYTDDGMIKSWQRQFGVETPTRYTFGYDRVNQLVSSLLETVGGPAGEGLRSGWTYDKAGNRTSLSVFDGSTDPVGKERESYAINTLNQLTAIRGDGPVQVRGTVDEPAVVTINERPARLSAIEGSADYLFEGVAEVSEGADSITIRATDASGNTSTEVVAVTSSGELAILEYDLNGNLLKRTVGSTVTAYEWDGLNRLLAIQDSALAAEVNGTRRSEFAYDGQSRRVALVEKSFDGSAWVVDSESFFLWNGSAIVQRRGDADAFAEGDKAYLGQGYQVKGSSSDALYYYTKDHLGSIREVIAADGETVETRLDYDPWGVTTVLSDTLTSGHEADFGYTGHLRHSGTGTDLYLTWFRAYDPNLGRWLSRDPIGIAGGLNLYGYVRNNPINLWDPLGLDDISYHKDGSLEDKGQASRGSKKNEFSVAGHGNPKSIADEREGKPKMLTPQQVANDIKEHPKYRPGMPTRLNACQTGKGGDESFAQELANELGSPVIAPTENLSTLAWVNPLTGSAYHLKDWVSNGGKWVEYQPE